MNDDGPIERLRQVRGRLREYVRSGRELGRALVARADTPGSIQRHEDLPVVSRLVLEIRSDGSRTVARGAMESVDRGERVAIQAAGNTPADAVIGVTQGCLDQFNREQLQGVMAHEFSHILNGDMRLNIRLIGVLHGIMVVGILGYFVLRSALFSGGHSRSKRDNPAPLFIQRRRSWEQRCSVTVAAHT